MLDSKKYISTQILDDIPQFIRMEYPNFVAFLVKYCEWMEEEGKPYHFIANALNYSDVDRTDLALLEVFGRNFLSPLPDVIYDQNNIATLVKNIVQYYSARGAEKSFQFLFRLFELKTDTSTEFDFYYPSYDMLRVSDGKWVNEKSVKIIDPPDDFNTWEGGLLVGETSGAKAIIDEVKTYTTGTNTNVGEIFLLEFDVVHTPEKFVCGETITVTKMDGTNDSSSTEKVFYGVNITNPGKFYDYNQRVSIISTNGEEARAVVDYVGKGVVNQFTIVNGGINYAVGERVYTGGAGFGSGAYGTITAVDGVGSITAIKMIFQGHDYRYSKEVLVDTVNGSDAIIMIDSDDIGAIQTVEIRDFGIGYELADTTLVFNTMMRVYDEFIDMEIGERITGQSSGAIGIIEYWSKETNVMSVYVESGIFEADEQIVGERYGGTAEIYDVSIAEGELIEGCVCNYKGRYINQDGHISSLKYIQDSYFYQMFSYMIKTDKDKSEWVDYVKHVHPAGTIGFSYRDIMNTYFMESYGGFIGPQIDTTEFYKFRWVPTQYDTGALSDYSNTQIIQYADIVIDDVANINNNILNKTGYLFGSEITIS